MSTTTELETREVLLPPALLAQVECSVSDPAEISAVMGAALAKLNAFLTRNDMSAAGPPRTIYTSWEAGATRFTVAIPIVDAPPTVAEQEGVSITAVPERSALRFMHYGPYRELHATYERIDAWLREHGGIKTPADWARYAPMWEEYLNDPGTTPEAELVTRIFLTLR